MNLPLVVQLLLATTILLLTRSCDGFLAPNRPHSAHHRMMVKGQQEEIATIPQQSSPPVVPQEASTAVVGEEEEQDQETKNEKDPKKMMQQIKDAGLAGVISYALWELGFWTISLPLTLIGYQRVTGHWPDLSDKEDLAKLSAEAFAFVNFARFAVPLRIGLALSTTSWIQANIVDKFIKQQKNDNDDGEQSATSASSSSDA